MHAKYAHEGEAKTDVAKPPSFKSEDQDEARVHMESMEGVLFAHPETFLKNQS